MIFWFFFFFQAEDGIRDDLVTGVQTCALPIWRMNTAGSQNITVRSQGCDTLSPRSQKRARYRAVVEMKPPASLSRSSADRSEERRVGKECRSRRWRYE